MSLSEIPIRAIFGTCGVFLSVLLVRRQSYKSLSRPLNTPVKYNKDMIAAIASPRTKP